SCRREGGFYAPRGSPSLSGWSTGPGDLRPCEPAPRGVAVGTASRRSFGVDHPWHRRLDTTALARDAPIGTHRGCFYIRQPRFGRKIQPLVQSTDGTGFHSAKLC